MTQSQQKVVSFDDESLILVDEDNNVLGHKTKADCHTGEGILHRAFSIFVFNDEGQMLLQQRSESKLLWPLYWSNSCCSHPRKGESETEAAGRRLKEELGLECDLEFLFRFRYQALFGELGAEHELCSVFVGRSSDPVVANTTEIADWAWVDVPAFERDLSANPDRYTPWLKLEWSRIRAEHWDRIQAYLS